MSAMQKTVVIPTLVFLAVFFHVLFCDWEHYSGSPEFAQRYSDITIIPLKTGTETELGFGVLARSSTTHTIDAIFGIALPVVLIAAGIYMLPGSSKTDPPSTHS